MKAEQAQTTIIVPQPVEAHINTTNTEVSFSNVISHAKLVSGYIRVHIQEKGEVYHVCHGTDNEDTETRDLTRGQAVAVLGVGSVAVAEALEKALDEYICRIKVGLLSRALAATSFDDAGEAPATPLVQHLCTKIDVRVTECEPEVYLLNYVLDTFCENN